jgi:hypothetical protein
MFYATDAERANPLINLKELFTSRDPNDPFYLNTNNAISQYLRNLQIRIPDTQVLMDMADGQADGTRDAMARPVWKDVGELINAIPDLPRVILGSPFSDEIGLFDSLEISSYYKQLLQLQGDFYGAAYYDSYGQVVAARQLLIGSVFAAVAEAAAVASASRASVAANAGRTAETGSTVANAGRAENYVDILSSETKQHILYGDKLGSGGHLWPGQPGKTAFPETWSADKIVHEVGDIATSPNTQWYAQTGTGGIYTNIGKPANWVAYEIRDGIRIRVVYQPALGRVVTAFPDNSPIPAYKPIK